MTKSDNQEKQRMETLKIWVGEQWEINPVDITRLMGYEVATYSVETDEEAYILKRYPDNPHHTSMVLFENKVLVHLQGIGGVPCPKLIPTKENAVLLRHEDSIYRLQTYLNGTFLAEAALTRPLLSAIGEMLGRIDKALLLIHAPYPVFDQNWDLRHAAKTEQLLPFIQNVTDRRLAAYFLYQFKAEVLSVQYDLPEQLIYADANEWNLLTEGEAISGIIDFGDMCYSWRINELAIALAYALMFSENPMEDAVPMIRAYHSIHALTEVEVEVLYYLIAARLSTSVCWSAKNKIEQPENQYLTISEARAWKLLHQWIQINPEWARTCFRTATGLSTTPKTDVSKMRSQRDNYLSRTLSLSYTTPIPMVRAGLQYMYDADGKTYLDAYNNIMLVGHAHPRVVEAGSRTYARLNTNTRYLYDELTEYAKELLSYFPPELCRVFFVNSGSAAADLALRMAFHHTGKRDIVALEEGYHGNTVRTIEASPYKTKKGKKPDTTIELELPNAYILRDSQTDDPGSYFAERAISRIQKNPENIAAFIAEPIVGCGGQVPLPPGYLKQIYPEIRATGGVCISDEVQVGFGRLGRVFWGYELQDVVPDIVILGKPMGNGHPIGAVVTRKEIATSFETGPEFFSSFGGNPVSCAIGKAVLEVIREEGLQEHALDVGTYFKEQLQIVQKEHPELADIRGEGLFLGVEIRNTAGNPDGDRALAIADQMKEDGVLVSTDGPFNQVIKIKPPLCFSLQNVDDFVRIFRKSLTKTQGN